MWRWLEERWPFGPVVNLALDEKITGGASYFYTLGSSVLILFILQAITGVMQMFFYVPSIDHAYNSLSYLRTQVPFGWLIHGLHYWGANLIIIVLVLHMLRVFLWGAYKNPRELTWLAGVFLALTLMAFSFTGAPLHWDQRGYWAGEVGTSIAGTVPIVGNLTKHILRGGENMGQLTISRFFAVHTMVLPAALLGLFGFHFIAFRRFGNVGPWDKMKRRYSGPFWPDQAIKDVVVGSSIFYLLIALTVFSPPSYSGPADPLDTSYIPKPEWNFLFLYQGLKYFQGPLEPVGTVGVPSVIIMLLLILPFVDRNPERNPLRRPVAMAFGLVFIGALGALTLIGHYSKGFAVSASSGPSAKEQQASSAKPAQGKEGEQKVPDAFQSAGCTGCHKIGGSGGNVGPELNAEVLKGKSRQWLTEQIRNPKSHDPDTVMPSFSSLPDAQVNKMVDFLMSMTTEVSGNSGTEKEPEGKSGNMEESSGPSAALSSSRKQGPESVKKGEKLFESQGCIGCHKIDGKGGTTGPNLSKEQHRQHDRQWLIKQIRSPKSHNPNTVMPPFSSLSDDQVNALIDYILSLGSQKTAGSAAGPTEEKRKGEEHPERAASEAGRQSGKKPGPSEKEPKGKPGEASRMIGNADHGAELFKNRCVSCHGEEGKGGVANPGSERGVVPTLNPIEEDEFSKNPGEFAGNIDRFLQHGSTPAGPAPSLSMPAFGDTHTLTQQEIANIEAYILKLNGVDRAELIDPGMQPHTFFWIITALYIALILFQGGLRTRRNIS
jgi:ubiquinol-cytochrome c reductase cytochrome b subunit